MDAIQEPEAIKEIQNQLTPEHASNIFVASFRHSQGLPDIQKNIFSYLHSIRPDWKITPEDKPEILNTSKEKVQAFLFGKENKARENTTHSKYPTKEVAKRDIEDQFEEMEEQLNNQEEADQDKKEKLIQKIANGIIDRDSYFLDKGRKISYIVHYGLNEHSTGIPEINEMYKEVRKFITLSGIKDNKKLAEVLRIYGEKNPGVQINLDPEK